VKVSKTDKAKLAKAFACVLVWGLIIVGIGSVLGNKPAKTTMPVKSSAEVRQDIQQGKGSDATKEIKLNELNLQAVIKGMKTSETILGISEWEKPVSKARDGIPALQVYFPQGQSMEGWNESFVLRSFVNITLPNPYPAVYEVYAEWLKTQVPDLQITQTQDSTGVSFVGQSREQNLYITGKVYSGAVKEAVHIAQYAVKGSDATAQDKVNQWKANFSKIKP
jgi:hypothetical protein